MTYNPTFCYRTPDGIEHEISEDNQLDGLLNGFSRCMDCKYFQTATFWRKGSGFQTLAAPQGTCRFNPPTEDGFPVCKGDDWCGKHEKCSECKELPTTCR